MRNLIRQALLSATWIVLAHLGATANAQGGVVFNQATGSYTITYQSDGGLSETTYIPGGQVAPSVLSAFRLMENKAVVYRYTVANGATAKQAIQIIDLDGLPNPLLGERLLNVYSRGEELVYPSEAEMDEVFAANLRAMATPLNWDSQIDRSGAPAPGIRWASDDTKGNLRWTSDYTKGNLGIAPGNKAGGFGFASMDLPGILPMKLKARGSGIVYADEGPADNDPITKQIDQLRDNDFIAKPVAVPVIAVPAPFDAAILLDRIRTQVATWPGKQLLDPAFAAQLDRSMVAAANAFRNNQSRAGREHIESLRRLLDHEHKYLDHDDEDNDDTPEHKAATRLTIDRLAARVLDFDLRFVLKRMEKEHERDHDEGDRRKER